MDKELAAKVAAPSGAKIDALRAKLATSVSVFGKVCLPTAYEKDIPLFHNEIYEALLDDSIKRLLIAAPRGTAKSTMVSLVYPMFKLMTAPDTEQLFIIIVSESRPQSINFISRIKSHLDTDEPLKDIYGDFGEATAKRWREDDIILANGNRVVAIGSGSRIRGFIEKDTRPTLIIMDDIESETNANTPEARAKTRSWVTEAVIPSMADDGSVVYIGTPFSEDCFLYYAKGSKRWKTLWYSIIDDKGNSIWPSKFPLSRIKEIKEDFVSVGNLNGFFQEYMCQAQSPEDAPFKVEYMKQHYYNLKKDDYGEWYLEGFTEGRDDDEIERFPVDLYTGVDPASSLSKHADYFVVMTLAVDTKDNIYIVGKIRVRMSPDKQPQTLIDTFLKYSPLQKMRIETIAYQEMLRATVSALCKEKNIYIPGLETGVKPRNSKSERLLSLVPMMARGKFFFREEDSDVQQEFLAYPRGKHDDCLDAIWTALYKHLPCRRKEINKTKEKKKKHKKYDWRVL